MSSAQYLPEEQALGAAFEQQRTHYSQALRQMQDLLEDLEQGTDQIEEKMAQIGITLNRVKAVDQNVKAEKERWTLSKAKPSPHLRSLMEEVTSLIRQLLDRSASAEKLAEARKSQILPAMARRSHSQKVQQAYQQAQRQ